MYKKLVALSLISSCLYGAELPNSRLILKAVKKCSQKEEAAQLLVRSFPLYFTLPVNQRHMGCALKCYYKKYKTLPFDDVRRMEMEKLGAKIARSEQIAQRLQEQMQKSRDKATKVADLEMNLKRAYEKNISLQKRVDQLEKEKRLLALQEKRPMAVKAPVAAKRPTRV